MSILQRFKSIAANTHNSVTGVKQDVLFDVADFVHEMLQQHELTQRELAKRINMKESQLSRILNSEGNPTIETIARIYRAFGCRPHLIVRNDEIATENLIAGSNMSFATDDWAGGNENIDEEIAAEKIEVEYA